MVTSKQETYFEHKLCIEYTMYVIVLNYNTPVNNSCNFDNGGIILILFCFRYTFPKLYINNYQHSIFYCCLFSHFMASLVEFLIGTLVLWATEYFIFVKFMDLFGGFRDPGNLSLYLCNFGYANSVSKIQKAALLDLLRHLVNQ